MSIKYFIRGLWGATLLLLSFSKIDGQCVDPPNGTGCLCSTADILCTPDELDGFTFSMSDEVNDGDLPDNGPFADLCPGINSQDGFPNNVNFFAFIAWCEDLTFDVIVSNCEDNPDDNQTSYGIQMALFGGCGSQGSGWDPVLCFTEGSDYCYDDADDVPGTQTFDMTGLIIGNTYYFMLDGCARSTCDIEIDVVGVCGTGSIDDWSEPVEGPTSVCTDQAFTYSVEDLDGAVEYYYYVDGVLVEDGTELNSIDYTFTSVGTYEICVDVSNLPCVLESDSPDLNCITVDVFEMDAGEITINPTPLCPDETATVTVDGYNTDPLTNLVLYVVNEDGIIEQVIMGDNTTATYDQCATWTVYSYNYIIADDPTIQNVGDVFVTIDCGDDCCDVVSEDISWEDTEPPVIQDKPMDETVDCEDQIPVETDLTVTDNCLPDWTITSDEQINYTPCDGGTISRLWAVNDSCGNSDDHTQVITIDPIILAEWIDPPASETVTCENKPTSHADLTLTNMSSGSCLIEETITPSIEDNTTECGGEIIVTWMFTDLCDRDYEHIQTITVTEPDPPTLSDMPSDVTLICGEAIPPAIEITVTNSSMGECLLEEVLTATVEDNTNDCDGTIVYTWTYMDACDNMLDHTQTITILPPDAPVFDQLPADETVMCSETPTTTTDLNYDNGMTGDCQITGTVSPTVDNNTSECGGTITYLWTFTDDCDRTIMHTQVITIDPTPEGDFIDVPEDITVPCGDAAGEPVDLEFTNGEADPCEISATVTPMIDGAADVCGSTVTYTWTFTDNCNRTKTATQVITYDPAPEAEWIDAPEGITIACADFDDTPPSLSYTNGDSGDCEIMGSVPGTLIGEPGPCGESVSFFWEFTDDCDRTITHTQVIDIEEASEPAFDNLPDNITISCDEADDPAPDLTYTNGETGFCERSGTVMPIQSGSYDACGGVLVYTWTTTDECGFTLTHSQTVTVDPAPDPFLVDPPQDLVLDCGEEVPDPEILTYTNGATGSCLISGEINATSNTVGLVTTYIWTYANECDPDIILTHEQEITETPSPDIDISPTSGVICFGDDYDLSTITVTDLNGGAITVEYLDAAGAPTNTNLVSPLVSTFIIIRITNEFGCTDEANFDIQVDSPVSAGNGTSGTACVGLGFTNLFDFLEGTYDDGGTWFDIDGSSANINFPQAVSFNGVPSGTYQFDYTVFSGNACPDVTATIFIEIVEDLDIEVDQLMCDPGGETYTITVNTNGNEIFTNFGTVTVIDDNTSEVTGIPIFSLLVITALDGDTGCLTEVFVNPPDCDCPDVDPPSAPEPTTICVGDDIPTIEVTVGAGQTANWYDAPTGGTLLQAMSTTYTPTETVPGIYMYYVNAEDADGCVSFLRTEVIFEIIDLPELNDVTIDGCLDSTGDWLLDLATEVNNLVNSNASFTYQYYMSLTDAEAGMGEILPQNILINTNTTLTVKVTNTQGCANFSTVNIEVLTGTNIMYTVVDEQCLGDENGQIIIDNISAGGLVDLDDTLYMDVALFDSLTPEQYVLNAISSDGCLSSDTIQIAPGPDFIIEDLDISCSNSDTETDPLDDIYTISFTVNGTDASDISVLDMDGMGVTTTGTDTIKFTISADETVDNLTFTVLNTNTGCSTLINTGALNPCSTDCSFILDELVPMCDGNDTPSDPSDDVYTVVVNATGVNGNAALYTVSVDNVISGTFPYGVGGIITIPATQNTVTITVTDSEDDQCFQTQIIGPLAPCSDECIMAITDLDFPCDSNETAGIEDDDTYTITFTISPTNAPSDSAQVILGGAVMGTFAYGDLVTLSVPASGLNTLEIQDQVDSSCAYSEELDLSPCSGSCTIEITATDPICFNQSTADDEEDDTYTAEITITITDGSGTWTLVNDGSQGMSGETITVGPYLISDGDTTLTFTDVNIASCTQSITLIAPSPCSNCEGNAEAGADEVLTCEVGEVTLVGTATPDPINSSWQDPSGQVTIGNQLLASSIGIYYFIADYGDNCIKTDSLQITADDSVPVANGGPDLIFDCDTDSLILYGSVSGGSGNFTYQWTDESGALLTTEDSVVIYAPGLFSFSVLDVTTGCEAPVYVVNVEDKISGPTAVIYTDPGDILDCVIEVIYLSSDEESGTIYNWSINGQPVTTEQLSITDSAQIVLVAIDTLTGCENSDQLNIPNLIEYPLIDIAPYDSLDCDNMEVTIDASNSQSGPNINSTWYNEDGEEILTDSYTLEATSAGMYILLLEDASNGCTNSDTIEVQNIGDFPEIELEPSLTVDCDEESVNISVQVVSSEPNLDISWSSVGGNIVSGETTTNIIVDGPGLYTVSVNNPDNNCLITATTEVQYPEQITELSLDTQDESCEDNADGFAEITLIQGGTEPYQYFLDGEEVTMASFSELTAGTYTLQIVDANACLFDTVFTVGTLPPFEAALPSALTVAEGNAQTLTIVTDLTPSEIGSIRWSPSDGLNCDTCQTVIFDALEDQSYTVTIIDINGCELVLNIALTVEPTTMVTFPNIFNPGGDNTNTRFYPITDDEGAIVRTFSIYDRWGNLVYTNSNFAPNVPDEGWDGTLNGSPVEQGVYVYYSEIELSTGSEFKKAGDITVMR